MAQPALMTTRIITGDCRATLAEMPSESVHCCVTSPPYFNLRDYGVAGQIGLEPTPAEYVSCMVEIMRDVRRVLRSDATLWMVVGDSYAGGKTGNTNGGTSSGLMKDGRGEESRQRTNVTQLLLSPGLKPKDLIGIPWMLAFALRDDGWYLRSEITWAKRAPMPESVTDRPTSATEKVFLLTRSPKYFYDAEAVKEEASENTHAKADDGPPSTEHAYAFMGGTKSGFSRLGRLPSRNMRNWWLLGPEPYAEAHFAVFPTEIPRRAILAGTSERGVCPKCGAPWERMRRKEKRGGSSPSRNDAASKRGCGNNDRNDAEDGRSHMVSETTGWRPTCAHDAAGDPVPATVLDPFLGAGTTALVADQLGRSCIGIDLNPTYAAMARRRIEDDAGMFADVAAE